MQHERALLLAIGEPVCGVGGESRGLVDHAHRRLPNAVWHVFSEPVELLELGRAPMVPTALPVNTDADHELLRLASGPRDLTLTALHGHDAPLGP